MAGYELRPVAIDRPAGRWPLALTAAAGLVAAMLMVKPWSVVIGGFEAPAPIERHAPAAVVPAAVVPPVAATSASDAPSALGSLARHSGTWGVGASGLGPHNEAEPWAGWTAVEPIPVAVGAGTPASPSRGLCDGVPTLPTDALFMAVSHEIDVPIDRTVLAWWWDHGTAKPLEGAIHQVTPTGDRGIAYVVRDDRAPWLAGRYVFRLAAADQAVDLAVCLVATP
jgi:hypothetical protein